MKRMKRKENVAKYITVDGIEKESLFLDFLQENRIAIRDEIFQHVPDKSKIMPEEYGLHHHKKMLSEYPDRGGKYVRPGLVLLSTIANKTDISKGLKTAAAMEISEDWILIHDDFEDHSLERRGKPSLPVLYGDELSVNAGDHLHLIMWDVLMSNQETLGIDKTMELYRELNSLLQKTCEGQFLEIGWTTGRKLISEDEYFAMVDRKTCWYTIIGPLRLGAIVSDNQKAMNSLIEFGLPLGRAFQIHDDWLNVFSTDTGKELGGDIVEGKRTLLLIKLLDELRKAGDNETLAWVKSVFSMDRNQRDFFMTKQMIELYEEYGIKDMVRDITLEYASEAKKQIRNIPGFNDNQRLIFEDAVDFLVHRGH